MDLSGIEDLVVTQQSPDCVLLEWRAGGQCSAQKCRDDDSGYVDPEDVLWLLLRAQTPMPLVRSALGTCFPDFDVDAEIDFVTTPDRLEQHARDEEHRKYLEQSFKECRRFD